ncbi:DMT family transporter [Salipiger thiooxidans]|jgi:drug/metabolite transporter (DMT)-like permease|uniref:DMT family transporter n=1 Tax=Salipiger thiooxidans TaxID=282683 RepID=UPI000C67DDB2|nr:DMT family transporter [Salipiger thiooxidans]MAU45305.1 EamA family transporter [Salipiger sp.]MBN8186640.1 DMT family transporter [Salipiger thiooxidans]MCA0847761.1 DMT family transporter [Salipiger thiooxidans]NVK61220.1 DMT family transporter [Paracoccaceae bacterium]
MSQTLKAVLWMSGAIVSFTTMAVAGREVSLDLDTFEIMLYRSLIGVVIVVTLLTATGQTGQVTRRRLGLHLARNLCHFAGQNLWFFAVAAIPIAQVFALEFTSPLWVIVLSPFVLGEKLTPTRALAAVLGFVGILVVARPSPETINPGLIAAALAAIGFAGSAVTTRRLTRTETTVCILFWLTVMQSVFGLVCAGIDGDIAFPAATSWPWVVLIAIAGLVAHYCLTTALSLAPAPVVMPIDFARLPVAALVGIILYQEALDPYVFIGAAIIFGANYFNILHETRPRPVTTTQK